MDFLKKKVFGVPVVYVGGLFVAVLAFIAWRMKPNMSNAADGSTADATNKDAITGADNPYDMFKTTGTVTVQQGSDPATVTPIGNRTNDAWARQSAEWLTANGTASDVALTSMMKYVNGEQLSIPEGQLRDRAVAQFGYPPEAFTTGGTAPNTPAAAAPAARQFTGSGIHYVKGENDNTYAKIAALYIGTGQDYANFLSAHNAQLPANGALQVGSAVKVPPYETKLYMVPAGTQMNAAQIASKNGASAEFISRLNNNAPSGYVWGPGRQVRVR